MQKVIAQQTQVPASIMHENCKPEAEDSKESKVPVEGTEHAPTENINDMCLKQPDYNPDEVEPGILHIGTGRFALAFLASYVQEILAIDPSWGMVAASMRSCDMIEQLEACDNTFLLAERENDNCSLHLMAPVVDTVAAAKEPEELVEWIADERIHLLTITITCVGYHMVNQHLNTDIDQIKKDIDLIKNDTDAKPETIYGYLAQGLKLRSEGNTPLTIMSLDNLEHNGHCLHVCLSEFLKLANASEELVAWIDKNVQFLTTMVDRIAPDPACQDTEAIKTGVENAGVKNPDDQLVILTEPFRQLVIEPEGGELKFDNPEWEQLGAKLVPDCDYFWKRKGRIVNGGHFLLAICGYRLGIEHIDETMDDSYVVGLLTEYHGECLATLTEKYDKDNAAYAAAVRDRYRNKGVRDEVIRVGASGTRKVCQRLFDALLEYHQKYKKILPATTFTAALWFINLVKPDDNGKPITQKDEHEKTFEPIKERIEKCVNSKCDPKECAEILKEMERLTKDERFGQIAAIEDFVRLFALSIRSISTKGLRGAIGQRNVIGVITSPVANRRINSPGPRDSRRRPRKYAPISPTPVAHKGTKEQSKPSTVTEITPTKQ